MTDGCCPRLKQIQATIVRYKKNSDGGKAVSVEAEKETKQFQGRVTNLKSKLDEANANIAILRAFVSQADIDIDEARPKTPKKSKCEKLSDTIEDLKDLIVKLNSFQHQGKVVTERYKTAARVLDELENQKCYCALVTESCEQIKKDLADITEEKEILEETIDRLKNPVVDSPSPKERLAAVRKEIEDVKACTPISCPNLNNKQTDIGVQNTCCPPCPSKIPKLMQTDANRKWNQGTNPFCPGKCNKATGR